MSAIYGTDLCRACLTPTKSERCLGDSVIVDGFVVKVGEIFNIFSSISVVNATSERFPTKLCKPCFVFLYEVSKFAKIVQRTETHLKTLQNLDDDGVIIAEREPVAGRSLASLGAEPSARHRKRSRLRISTGCASAAHPKQFRILPKIQTVVPVDTALVDDANRQTLPDASQDDSVPVSNFVEIPMNYEELDVVYVKDEPINIIDSHDESPITCHNCNEGFLSKDSLVIHLESCQLTAPNFESEIVIPHEDNENNAAPGAIGELQCAACHLQFRDSAQLSIHRGACGSDAASTVRNVCGLCGKTYKNKTWLSIHTIKQHGNNVCPWCNMCFRTGRSLTEHVSSHTAGGVYVCLLCTETFKNLKSLKIHTNYAHKENLESYFCGECGPESQFYSTFEEIQQHLSDHPAEKPPDSSTALKKELKENALKDVETKYYTLVDGADGEEYVQIPSERVLQYLGEDANFARMDVEPGSTGTKQATTAEEIPSDVKNSSGEEGAAEVGAGVFADKRKFRCAVCGARLKHMFSLKRHMTVKHKMKLVKYDAPSSPDKLEDEDDAGGEAEEERHVRDSHRQRFKCPICGVMIKRKFNLGRHITVTHMMQRYKCRVCTESFNTRAKLTEHKLTHGDDQKIEANAPTDKMVKSKTQSAGKNKPPKPYPKNLLAADKLTNLTWPARICKLCNQRFAQWIDLYNHTRKEHGKLQADKIRLERFQCQICGKKLTNNTSHNSHMWRIHLKTRFHRCEECGRRYISQKELKLHMLKHKNIKPHLCQECGKSFFMRETLRKHVDATHNNKRDFLCSICGRTFLQSSHVKQHMWKHTGVKPNQCQYCTSAFTSSTGLKKHILKIHPEEVQKRQNAEEERYESLKGVSFEVMVDSILFGKNIEGDAQLNQAASPIEPSDAEANFDKAVDKDDAI